MSGYSKVRLQFVTAYSSLQIVVISFGMHTRIGLYGHLIGLCSGDHNRGSALMVDDGWRGWDGILRLRGAMILLLAE